MPLHEALAVDGVSAYVYLIPQVTVDDLGHSNVTTASRDVEGLRLDAS